MVGQDTDGECEHFLVTRSTQYGSISGHFSQEDSDAEKDNDSDRDHGSQSRNRAEYFSDSEPNYPYPINRGTSPAPKYFVWLGYIFSGLSGLCFVAR